MNTQRQVGKLRPYRVDYFDIDEMKDNDLALVKSVIVRAVTSEAAIANFSAYDNLIFIRAYRYYKSLVHKKNVYKAVEDLFPKKKAIKVMEHIEAYRRESNIIQAFEKHLQVHRDEVRDERITVNDRTLAWDDILTEMKDRTSLGLSFIEALAPDVPVVESTASEDITRLSDSSAQPTNIGVTGGQPEPPHEATQTVEGSSDCLTATEIINYYLDNGRQLDTKKLAHIEGCNQCQLMLARAGNHTGDGFWQEFRRRQRLVSTTPADTEDLRCESCGAAHLPVDDGLLCKHCAGQQPPIKPVPPLPRPLNQYRRQPLIKPVPPPPPPPHVFSGSGLDDIPLWVKILLISGVVVAVTIYVFLHL